MINTVGDLNLEPMVRNLLHDNIEHSEYVCKNSFNSFHCGYYTNKMEELYSHSINI